MLAGVTAVNNSIVVLPNWAFGPWLSKRVVCSWQGGPTTHSPCTSSCSCRARFNDTKGGVADIVNGHSIIAALQSAKSVRPVLLLTSRDFGNRETNEIASLADLLNRAMPLKAVVRSFSYIFTSGWNDSHRMSRSQFCTTFRNILHAVREEDKNEDAELLAADLLAKLETHPHDHVNSIDVSRPQQRVDILDSIYETPPIERPAEVFRKFVPSTAIENLHNQCEIVCTKIKMCVKGSRAADVVLLLHQLRDVAALLGDECVARYHREALEGAFEALSNNAERFKQTLERLKLMKSGVDRENLDQTLQEALSGAGYVMQFRSIHAVYAAVDFSFVVLSAIRDCVTVLLKRVDFAPSDDWNVGEAASASTAHTVLGSVWAVFRDFVSEHFEQDAQDMAGLLRGADEQLQSAFDACAAAMREAAHQQSDARAVVKAAGVLRTLAQSAWAAVVPSPTGSKGSLEAQFATQMQALQSTLHGQLGDRASGLRNLNSELSGRLGAGTDVGSTCRFVEETFAALVEWHKWLLALTDAKASEFVDPTVLLSDLLDCVRASLRAGVQQAKACCVDGSNQECAAIAVWCYSVDKLRRLAERVGVPAVTELVDQSYAVDVELLGFLTQRLAAAKRSLEAVQTARALRGVLPPQAYVDLSGNLSTAAAVAACLSALPAKLTAFEPTRTAAENVIGSFGQYAAAFRKQCLEGDNAALAAITRTGTSAGPDPNTGRSGGNNVRAAPILQAPVPLSKMGTPALVEALLQSDPRLGRVAQVVRDYDVEGSDLAVVVAGGGEALAQFFAQELSERLSAEEVEAVLAALGGGGGQRREEEEEEDGAVAFPKWSLPAAHEACLAHAHAKQLLPVMLAVGQQSNAAAAPAAPVAAAAAAATLTDSQWDNDGDDDGVDLLAEVAQYSELLRRAHANVSAFCRETALLLRQWREDGFQFTGSLHQATLGERAALLVFVGEICHNSRSQSVLAQAGSLAASLEECNRFMAGGFRDRVVDTCSALWTVEAPAKVEELLGLLQHVQAGPWATSHQALNKHLQQQQSESARGEEQYVVLGSSALAVASSSVLSTVASIAAEASGRSAAAARDDGEVARELVARSPSWSLRSLHLAVQAKLQQLEDAAVVDGAGLKSLLETLQHFQRLDSIVAKFKFRGLHERCSLALSKAETDFRESLKLALGRQDFKDVKHILLRNGITAAEGDTAADIVASLVCVLTQTAETLALFADEATASMDTASLVCRQLAQLGGAAAHLSAAVFRNDEMTGLLAEVAQLHERGCTLVQERTSHVRLECEFALASLQFDKFESGCKLVGEWQALWNSAHSGAEQGYEGRGVSDSAAAVLAALQEAKEQRVAQLLSSFEVGLSVQLLQKQPSPKEICRALRAANYSTQLLQDAVVRFRAAFVDAISAVRALSAEDVPPDRENLVKYIAANSSDLFPKEMVSDVKQKASDCVLHIASAFDAAADCVAGAIATFAVEQNFNEYWAKTIAKLPSETRQTAAQLDR